jgi:hypothetical protein
MATTIITGTTIVPTSYGNFVVQHTGPGKGTINFPYTERWDPNGKVASALRAVEDLILAHACRDVKLVLDADYLAGLDETLAKVYYPTTK